jgi:hypothetical protein
MKNLLCAIGSASTVVDGEVLSVASFFNYYTVSQT